MNDPKVTLSRLLGAGSIKRTEEGDDKVRYTNVMLLGPGEWTDSASRTTVYYAPDAIKKSAGNWIDPRDGEPVEKAPLNHHHQHDVPAENVGYVDTRTCTADADGHLYADIVFHRRTQRSREMEEMMKLAMEEEGQEGLGGISVEIPADDTDWDEGRGMEVMEEMWFSGAGLVMNPASATVSFENQSSRVAALSAPAASGASLFVRESSKSGGNGQGGMKDEDLPPAIRNLRRLQEEYDEMEDEMTPPDEGEDPEGDEGDEGGFDAAEYVQKYLEQEEAAPEDSLTELQAWAADALDDEEMAAMEEKFAEFTEATGMEMEEALVGDFLAYCEDDGGEDPEDDGGDVPPEEQMAEMSEAVEGLSRSLAGSIKALSERVEDLERELAEERKERSELEKELSEVRDGEVRRTLGGSYENDDEDEAETTAPKVHAERGRLFRE
jgi:hypothetical protein